MVELVIARNPPIALRTKAPLGVAVLSAVTVWDLVSAGKDACGPRRDRINSIDRFVPRSVPYRRGMALACPYLRTPR
jgi:hypothetical protein